MTLGFDLLESRMPRQRPSFRGRVLRVIETRDGTRLHDVVYSMPIPGYRKQNCKVPSVLDPDGLCEQLWNEALSNRLWCRILDRVLDGLGARIAADYGWGLTWQSPSGYELLCWIHDIHQRGLLALILRALFIETDAQAMRFAEGIVARERDGEYRQLLQSLAEPDKDTQTIRTLARQLATLGLKVCADDDRRIDQPEWIRALIRASAGGG